MFKGKHVFCFIPARGGSKGVPNKNSLLIAGKPLLAYSIITAKEIKLIDEVYVSTENKKIKQIAHNYGAKVIDRPFELASDTANILDSMKHMIDKISLIKKNNVIIVIFYPTAPIRIAKEMEKCIKMLNDDIDYVISVTKSKIRPSYLLIEKDGLLEFWLKGKQEVNRQEQKNTYYYLTGSIFVTTSNYLKQKDGLILGGKMKKYVIDESESLDIDTKFDFELCKFVMESL